MDSSVFTDNARCPRQVELEKALGRSWSFWSGLCAYVFDNFTGCKEEWNYSKAGWNMRIKDKKRAIAYFMPCDGFFKLSLVFGEKATKDAMDSSISDDIKQIIAAAPVYGEGRGFRIEVRNKKTAGDIEKLLQIKKKY